MEVSNPFSKAVQDIEVRFDEATIAKDIDSVLSLVGEAESLIQTENSVSKATLYYSIATAYSDFPQLGGISENDSVKKQLYYFRKSIELIESEECKKDEDNAFVLSFKTVLFTNYANRLDLCGRKIAAIEQYKKALELYPQFGMALGNLGRAYMDYGALEYDLSRRDYFHFYAYSLLDEASICDDPNTHSDAKEHFANAMNIYDLDYINHLFEVLPNIPDRTYKNPDELAYRKWALDNGLFLNTLNDLPELKLRFAADVIQLPNMIVAVGAKPIFHGMYNQIKQEYIYARYMCYSFLQAPEEPHFADKETYLLNSPDYPQYSIRLEQLKTSYKTLYSLFDKIAYFINSYFDLGIKEKDVNFNSIWENHHGHGKYAYQSKNKLDPTSNFALSSLFWISKDFFKQDKNSPNPNLQWLRDIRHALEHKYVKITWGLVTKSVIREPDGLALYISEDELYTITLQLMRIVREAIICLAFTVNIEEQKRKGKMAPDLKILPMTIGPYDDEWKI